ncbi:CinA family protein [Commensalibacter papalotli (ex Botero et al. 2024)]|uniref:Nicotinamide mononucleotide (NMN) deamidase PncC (PncC) (PDB:2A9S) n=1 Tax=Commensalibacter papalotli (ex Botero et al. 2024) TaxID=2972766 RepID=A0ABN8W544_9PROT|nr:CinA family protein [Commensalibacter papalotli (ex Botero et al. 2024)]CAI3924326.1 Nicotinamide mononucleotide (NMN) deamidase PncC (PncC) (PDB:2A9S) [Commensalibacter papalotli (ex Botero et al. 2024)]CAI3927748.1 Nicotinamide mononucleotide (NMN) deamidase PncC (PncC) (PDB:2A9S) [Commensalibacter papalotli (ex Botero et al. 2024)]
MNIDILKQELYSLCLEFSILCKTNDLKLVTAESCTAGLICGYLTDLPGSSAYIEGGFAVYSNHMKATILDVSCQTLEEFGAVSEQTALEMVSGALRKASNANIAVSVTGYAGPDVHDNVGLVWIGFKESNAQAICKKYNFLGNREAIRLQTINEAIKLILKQY